MTIPPYGFAAIPPAPGLLLPSELENLVQHVAGHTVNRDGDGAFEAGVQRASAKVKAVDYQLAYDDGAVLFDLSAGPRVLTLPPARGSGFLYPVGIMVPRGFPDTADRLTIATSSPDVAPTSPFVFDTLGDWNLQAPNQRVAPSLGQGALPAGDAFVAFTAINDFGETIASNEQHIVLPNSVLAAPTAITAVPQFPGGSIPDAQTLYYVLTAKSAGGAESGLSAVVVAQTSGVGGGANQVQLNWQNAGPGGTRIYRLQLPTGNPGMRVADLGAGVTSYLDSAAWSNATLGQAWPDFTLTGNSITAQCDPVDGAVWYHYYYGTQSGVYTRRLVCEATSTGAQITDWGQPADTKAPPTADTTALQLGTRRSGAPGQSALLVDWRARDGNGAGRWKVLTV